MQSTPSASNPFTPAFPKLQHRWSKTSTAAARLYFRKAAKWVFRIQRNSTSEQGGEGNKRCYARPETLNPFVHLKRNVSMRTLLLDSSTVNLKAIDNFSTADNPNRIIPSGYLYHERQTTQDRGFPFHPEVTANKTYAPLWLSKTAAETKLKLIRLEAGMRPGEEGWLIYPLAHWNGNFSSYRGYLKTAQLKSFKHSTGIGRYCT